MSRKHNTKHPERGRSGYPARLAARGLSKAPTMATVEHLRYIQNRRVEQTGYPWPTWTELNEGAA